MDALSADPHQISRSPYAYAWNNPVVHIDPDGNCPVCAIVGAVIGGVGNLVVHAIQGKIHNFNDGLKAFGIGAVAGAVAGLTFNPALAEATATGLTAFESGFVAGAFSSVASTAVEGPFKHAGF